VRRSINQINAKIRKEKESFDFNDQQKVKDFIEQQRKQDLLMKKLC
jgi:uncharacterized protein (UPF0264 family)